MFKNKLFKYFSLAIVSASVIGTSSCGLTKGELASRAIQAGINASTAYLTPITVEQEKQIGVQAFQDVTKQYTEYTGNKELYDYVRSVGAKVIDQSTRKNELNYQVYIIDSPEINAFTIPGGSIFITTECLKYIKNEAELAGVLAHEVGHNERKHPVDTIRRAMALQGLAEGALTTNDSQVVQVLAGLSLNLILNGFSRKQEIEADETGTLLVSKMNYETDALAGFLKTLLSVSSDPKGLIKLFSTHPGSQDRINDINSYISKAGLSNHNNFTNDAVYQKYVSVLPAKVSLQ